MTSSTAETRVVPPPPGTYAIDVSRSTVAFTARHLFGLGGVAGSFALREASVTIGDPESASTFSAVIDARSFTSGSARRDSEVLSPKYLDAAAHPDIVVSGTSASLQGDDWLVRGSVRAHGVDAPLELAVDRLEVRDGVLVMHGTATIDRYAHGVTAGKGLAGRHLKVTIEAVAEAQHT